MTDASSLNMLAAWRLLDANRTEEALRLCAGQPEMSALMAHLGRCAIPADEAAATGETVAAIDGWRRYYTAAYADAIDGWRTLYPSGTSWMNAWLALGFAKVATDIGRFGTALGWAGVASAHARDGEHFDHLAAVSGARGEVLLRSGQPLQAAEAFAEDIALLPPGARYLGRVRCYRAHAWARLGVHGEAAAAIAYRQAAHSPHERSDPFAWAGLTLLAARRGERETVEQLLEHHPQDGMPGAWMQVSAVRVGVRDSERALRHAAEGFGDLYRWERRWLHAWATGLGVALAAPPESCRHDAPELPDWRAAAATPCRLDLPVDPELVDDRGYAMIGWPTEAEPGWQARERFMP